MTSTAALDALVTSWTLALEAENKSPRTIGNYRESMTLFGRWLVDTNRPTAPDAIDTATCRTWLAELIETRSASTARTRWNGLRHFFAWCLEEGETAVNPMALVKAPALPEKLVEFLTPDQLKDVIAACEGPLLVDRRDQTLILMYADTGARLSELATAHLEHLDLRDRTLLVTGKGRRERIVSFGARTARSVDRYLRIRGRQPYADGPWLWLSGKDGRALTANGIQQMLRRRGKQAGIPGLHAHMFRHGFADAWLRAGGSEGDLMELAGWRSRQMLTRYAAKTRAERAREAYKGRSPMDNL
ncbi:tyrosine-type recombinase/integrase [Nocardioides sp. SOB77]|uniref:Tyrosine-type recombinase/integrase n=1 Tax=Nocardioides oceani TaxID=3058369 RepID=A0ABT8FHM2_9ACTN|nr:tyrosine-type recombinase/integrase [Nocardioides oceani]MDN4173897.1 tyrosine-type recombinase/integrase [Nocardioides oceani]